MSTTRFDGVLVDKRSVGTGKTAGLSVENPTDAAAGAQQYSSMVEIIGRGFKTDATAASRTVRNALQTRPIEGAAAPTNELVLWSSVDTGTPSWLEIFNFGERFGDRDVIASGRSKAQFLANESSGIYIDGGVPNVNILTSGFQRFSFYANRFLPGTDLSAAIGETATRFTAGYFEKVTIGTEVGGGYLQTPAGEDFRLSARVNQDEIILSTNNLRLRPTGNDGIKITTAGLEFTAGNPKWNATNEQTTVGAAGAASAPPATPTKYLKVRDSAGTVLVIPAYAAS